MLTHCQIFSTVGLDKRGICAGPQMTDKQLETTCLSRLINWDTEDYINRSEKSLYSLFLPSRFSVNYKMHRIRGYITGKVHSSPIVSWLHCAEKHCRACCSERHSCHWHWACLCPLLQHYWCNNTTREHLSIWRISWSMRLEGRGKIK